MQLLAGLVPGIYQRLIYLFVIGALAGLYVTGRGNLAALGAVVLLRVRASTYGQQAQVAYQGVSQALPYLERMEEVKRRYAADLPPAGDRPLDSVRKLAFDGVGFKYEGGRHVLFDVGFEVDAFETVGIVGPTGAGK